MMQALLVLHGGIGDIVRCSCLARVLTGLGYTVDLLIVPHYPSAISLFEGHPEVRNVYLHPHPKGRPLTPNFEPIRDICYDLAIVKFRRIELKELIRAHRRIWSSVDSMPRGDADFCRRIASKLGWKGDLPNSFVLDSGRRFDLPEGTVAMHPGCHPNRYFKKWHGFAELAHHFPHVAIVGSSDDLHVETTYFQSAFQWPAHVTNFIPENLSLPDTAALLKQCRMMISNDSGLMHLAVAVGTPTYGIFGITSPQRELMPFPQMRRSPSACPANPPAGSALTKPIANSTSNASRRSLRGRSSIRSNRVRPIAVPHSEMGISGLTHRGPKCWVSRAVIPSIQAPT